jgi:hypothetical protein
MGVPVKTRWRGRETVADRGIVQPGWKVREG